MLPWVEKYRPKRLEDVVGNKEALSRMLVLAKEGNMPNLILSGPPGCGKTTSVLALAHTLLGPKYSECVIELNASDDRGIDVCRTRRQRFFCHGADRTESQTRRDLPHGKPHHRMTESGGKENYQ